MLSLLHENYKHIIDLWQQIRPVWAGIAAAIVALTTVCIKFKAGKKWIVEKYDGRILRLLLETRRAAQVNMRPGQTSVFLPTPLPEIAKDVKRSEKSVYSSLRRLENRGEVHEVRDGWNLGPRQDALTLANIEQRIATTSRWGDKRLAGRGW
jgi:hypothetical protein